MLISKVKIKKHKIIFISLLCIMVIMACVGIILIKNEEHYAKKRLCSVEKIVVRWINDGNGNYCLEGFDAKTIIDKSEVEEWREMLYDVETRGRWFSFDDGPPGWEVFFTVEVLYEDGYSEIIECTSSTRAFKSLGYKDSYALGSSEELYTWCCDLFYYEPNSHIPAK